MTTRTVATIAALTLREAARRRVLLALVVLTVLLLVLSGWGFSRLAAESGDSTLTTGEARLTASIGLVAFGTGFVVLAGLAQCLVVWATVGYWPPDPAVALALLAAQTIVLLTLAVLLSTAISPMASGVVAVGLFGTTWVAGVVGAVGASFGNEAVARVGSVSRMLLPTDGLWRGAMHAFQHPSALATFGGDDAQAFPFLSIAPLTAGYLAWAALWVAMVWGLAALSFARKDL